MSSTTDVVEQTTKYEVGDKVQVVQHHAEAGTMGTVTKVMVEPDREPRYQIRVIEPERDSRRFAESDLEPDDYGFVDHYDLGQIVNEIRAIAAAVGEFGSLSSPHYIERVRTLARLGYWASRASWLEMCDEERRAWEEEKAARKKQP